MLWFHSMNEWMPLCESSALEEGGLAFDFDVLCDGEVWRAFAVRFDGRVFAYLNRCTHIPMEMDMLHNRFFDDSGQWLVCSSHGATYAPDTGACAGGPCADRLLAVELRESEGEVFWLPSERIQPVVF